MQMERNLQKEAQAKLSEARKLIDEAGKLAEEGCFHLHFGEIGDYIPSGLMDDEKMRPLAIEEAKKEGKTTYGRQEYPKNELGFADYSKPPIQVTPDVVKTWDEMDEDEQEELVDSILEGMREEVPWEYREYGDGTGGEWWAPSRC
jgi:hypothetical protein